MSVSQTPVGIVGGKEDPRLTFLLNKTIDAVEIFTEAIRDSPDTVESIGFKAFTLKSKEKAEVENVFDLIMTKVAIELNKHSKDLVDKYTFFHEKKDSEEDAEEFNLFFYCKKVAPPTKAEIDKLVKQEEEESKVEVIEEVKEEESKKMD